MRGASLGRSMRGSHCISLNIFIYIFLMKTYILFVPKVNPSVIPYYPHIGNQPLHTTRKPLHDETGGPVRKSSFLGCQFARCTGILDICTRFSDANILCPTFAPVGVHPWQHPCQWGGISSTLLNIAQGSPVGSFSFPGTVRSFNRTHRVALCCLRLCT